MDGAEIVGMAAGVLTTFAYVPQAAKTWRTGSAKDLSLPMLLMLIAGLLLWLISGLMRSSLSLVAANAVTVALAGSILAVKLRGP